MMRNSQNSDTPNGQPSPTQDDELSREKSEPVSNSYYYDDATGYEIYHESGEDEDEGDRAKR
jgi:hypothetical protein